MPVTRRDMLKASAIVAGALGLTGAGILRTQQALAKVGGLKIVWLQAQSCTGCSVSLLNSIYYATIDNLLLNTLDLKYHSNVMAAAGKQASDAAEAAYTAGGYALVVEGAIPTADNGKACNLWPGLTAMAGVTRYASRATMVLAVGTCASFGGMAAGKPNPTLATSVKGLLGTAFTKPLINIPGCPVHPDWVVGTIAYILTNNKAPALDANLRPTSFYGAKVHDACPNRNSYTGPNHHSKGRVCTTCHGRGLEEDALNPNQIPAFALSQVGCLYNLGCRGVTTGCDCPTRKWNSDAAATAGVSWCVQARSPCFGCTEPTFPDGASPFYSITTGTVAPPVTPPPSGGGTGGGGTGGGGTGGGGTGGGGTGGGGTGGGGGNTGGGRGNGGRGGNNNRGNNNRRGD